MEGIDGYEAFVDRMQMDIGTSTSAERKSPGQNFSTDAINQMPETPPRRGAHRRAVSDVAFHLPVDAMSERDLGLISFDVLIFSEDVAEDWFAPCMGTEHVNSLGEDLQNSNVENFESNPVVRHSRSLSVDDAFLGLEDGMASGALGAGNSCSSEQGRPPHGHSNSTDGISFLEAGSLETKKAMAANKLSELSLIDPKRAKRILANRQSAARSKERKTRYIGKLEQKVQALQAEATTLSAQLTMLHRDTAGLTAENSELKLRLQAMEQQSHLRDVLNEALTEEVQRLKIATGQVSPTNGNAFKRGPQVPSDQSSAPPQSHNLNAQQFQQFQHQQGALNNQPSQRQPHVHSEFPQHGSVDTVQGLGGS